MPQKNSRLLQLRKLGQSPWLDFISREIINSGELKRLIQEGISGVTSNPTIFQKAIESSSYYDEEMSRLLKQGKGPDEIYDALTARDVADAADLLRKVYVSSRWRDGYVSIETWPRYAYDATKTMEYVRRIFQTIGRPNVMVKVPGTREGLPAIEQLTAEGININITLLFSLSHYENTAQAYLAGLEHRAKQGQELSQVASVASLFVSRIDTAVDRQLDTMARENQTLAETARRLRGQLAVANSKIIYQHFHEIFSSSRFQALARKGAHIQRVLWGSTGTKDPTYSDIKYVAELIGRDTINTMPPHTIAAFQDHGIPRLTIEEGLEAAHRVLDQLAGLGIDLEQVCQQIQDEGVKAFADSFDSLIATIQAKGKSLSAPAC